jgi:two-component system LytT family response regulator
MRRVALVDDEPLARKGLRHLLAAHPGYRIIGEADSKDSALVLLRKEKPDAIFLDIQMPGATGFDLLGDLQDPPQIVIVTAHARYAPQAFDVEAIDYLLKPVSPARFAQAIRRLEAACSNESGGAAETPYAKDDRICLRTPQRTAVVQIPSIPALQADGDFTRIYLKDSVALLICQQLGHYEKLLPTPPFVRLDRSLIVNLESVIRIDRKSRDAAKLIIDGVPAGFPLGRTAQARLREFLP